MKNFIKENLVLVVGLTLPLLLILLFFVATVIPKAFGTPPQYEMLFTTSRYDYQDTPEYSLDFIVKDQKLIVKAHKNDNKERRGYNSKLLMAYDGKTETVREINIDIVKAASAADGNEVVLEETSSWTIDESRISPDGYTLDGPSYRGGGLVGGILAAVTPIAVSGSRKVVSATRCLIRRELIIIIKCISSVGSSKNKGLLCRLKKMHCRTLLHLPSITRLRLMK